VSYWTRSVAAGSRARPDVHAGGLADDLEPLDNDPTGDQPLTLLLELAHETFQRGRDWLAVAPTPAIKQTL